MTYDALAEFHDLFMAEPWEHLRPAVAEAFGHLGPDAVIVDLGAGTGHGTLTVADTTAARVWAVEPSTAMRSVLLHRVAGSTRLSPRVSVIAGAVPAVLADLPPRVDGVLATHMVGHLSPTEREAWWAWLDATLTPGSVALVTHQPARAGDADDEDFVDERTIGDHVYRVTYLADAGAETFRSRYDVVLGDEVLRSVEVSGGWRTVTLDDLRAEAATHGLEVSTIDAPGVCLVRQRR